MTDESPDTTSGRKLRPTRRLLTLAAVVVGILLLIGAYVFGWSSANGVKEIQVEGTKDLSSEQLVSVAGIPLGTPMMRVDLRAAEARISDLPQVGSVDVRRQWPRTIVITVSERGLVAMQKSANGWELLDANGSPFALAAEKPKDLPTVKQSPDPATNTAMLQALAGMSPQVRAQVLSVSAASPNSIRLVMRKNDTVVNWGSADESEFKSQVLAILLGTDAGWIDVSIPQAPTTAEAPPAPAPRPTATTIPNPAGSPSPTTSPSASPDASGGEPAPAESAVGVVPE